MIKSVIILLIHSCKGCQGQRFPCSLATKVLLAPLLRNLLGEDGNLRMRDVARTWGSLYEILPKGGTNGVCVCFSHGEESCQVVKGKGRDRQRL